MEGDVEMVELAPEVKINMCLDDIIKHEKKKAAVSHNLQFGRGKKFYRPYFKRRYSSQNWRLRQNGPNTPRYQNYRAFKSQRAAKVRAFLEAKWKSKPLNSVFQRLGSNPLLQSARNKLYFARNYSRPQRPHFLFKKFNKTPSHDPDRLKKLIQSRRIYDSGDGLGGLSEDVQPLTKSNLERLTQVYGDTITSVKEEELASGTVVTTITRINPTIANQINIMNGNYGHNYGGAMNGYNEEMHSHRMGGIQNFNSLNGMKPTSLNDYNINGGNMNSMYGMHTQVGNNINPMFINRMNSLNRVNSQYNGFGMDQNNQINQNNQFNQHLINQLNQQEVIQSLNAEQKPVILNNGPVSGSNGVGIDGKLSIHATTTPFNMRFAGSSSTPMGNSC